MSDPDDASRWQAEDVISRGYKHDLDFMRLIENTKRVDDMDVERFDTIVVAGGQGPMFTFAGATALHRRFVDFLRSGQDRGHRFGNSFEPTRLVSQWATCARHVLVGLPDPPSSETDRAPGVVLPARYVGRSLSTGRRPGRR